MILVNCTSGGTSVFVCKFRPPNFYFRYKISEFGHKYIINCLDIKRLQIFYSFCHTDHLARPKARLLLSRLTETSPVISNRGVKKMQLSDVRVFPRMLTCGGGGGGGGEFLTTH